MARMYLVSIRAEKLPDPTQIAKVEKQFSDLGDWMRFTYFTWVIQSGYNPTQIRDFLRPTLPEEDQFMVLEVNPDGADGWAMPWVWDWLRARRK